MTIALTRHFTRRLRRNLVVTIAVTAIFGFKAAEPQAPYPFPEAMTLAARQTTFPEIRVGERGPDSCFGARSDPKTARTFRERALAPTIRI